ncbi:AAA family ATPase [Ferrovum myxofaciens]|jgi:pilus assembly protein CpaE|uniref:AAA family ATPase n=1 Tax=Ferrovum myxofaciens TaxID=416213 RepID=A0A859AAM9_9PROT|nr:AAA family ATPase [Ferrovum myxofaciens]MBW8028638.1 AAA family ATPase [Ferrovum sp.]KXW57810.1 CobQ/CobB/MinD/ParA nucleotide binding domain protein [Ferrovum myxofaciens]MBU6995508.1 AAA family ATPase [Ferrovum myxofaciens]QKE39286.1 MAG: AAA family ATPase [Ferrovum myxofaciens]QWY74547.1 MAG: AAA family ATPase [Ferrovum myxofaciens]
MKITVLSKNNALLHRVKVTLLGARDNDQVELVNRSASHLDLDMPDIANANLLILDGSEEEAPDWVNIEKFNLQHPHSSTILICAERIEQILVQAMRVGVRDALYLAELEDRLIEVVERARSRQAAFEGALRGGKVYSFIPSKGGSGASFISSNLAYILAKVHKKRVLMIDLDLEFSDASFCLTDDDSIKSIADLVARPHLSGPVIESASIQIEQTFWLLRAPQNPEMSVGITPDQVDDIISVAVRHYDFVCIDLARTLEPIALRVMDRSDVVFPVMQTVLPFVRGMQRLQRTFRALHYPESKIQLVANRQGNKDDLPMTDIENALQAKFVVRLPNDFFNVNTSINTGKPLMEVAPQGILTQALIQWSNQLLGVKSEEKVVNVDHSLLSKLTSLFRSS